MKISSSLGTTRSALKLSADPIPVMCAVCVCPCVQSVICLLSLPIFFSGGGVGLHVSRKVFWEGSGLMKFLGDLSWGGGANLLEGKPLMSQLKCSLHLFFFDNMITFFDHKFFHCF